MKHDYDEPANARARTQSQGATQDGCNGDDGYDIRRQCHRCRWWFDCYTVMHDAYYGTHISIIVIIIFFFFYFYYFYCIFHPTNEYFLYRSLSLRRTHVMRNVSFGSRQQVEQRRKRI